MTSRTSLLGSMSSNAGRRMLPVEMNGDGCTTHATVTTHPRWQLPSHGAL